MRPAKRRDDARVDTFLSKRPCKARRIAFPRHQSRMASARSLKRLLECGARPFEGVGKKRDEARHEL